MVTNKENQTMINERFSATKFAECGIDSANAKHLAELLEDEILQEIHEVIQTKFSEIIEYLNNMGHNLKLKDLAAPGDISFRDDWVDNDGYHCKLRVGIDVVVSTGYAHLINISDERGAYFGESE
jgi:hypothetical protein